MTYYAHPGEQDPLDIRGVVPPTITGFDEDENLNEAVTRTHVRFVVEAGAHGVFPLGTNGEFPLLTGEERDRIVEIVVDEVGNEVPVLAGVGAPSTHETILRAERAEAAGVDGLVVLTPYYYPIDDAGLVTHYRRIADAVDLPLYIYNIPKRTGNDISLETLDDLMAIDAIAGIKDSSGDIGWLGQAIDAHPERTFVAGSDALLYASLLHGCSGMVSAVANVFPEIVVDLYDAFVENDLQQVRDLQRRVYKLRSAIKHGSYIAGVKTALDLRGFDTGPLRNPLRKFNKEETEELATTLREIHREESLIIEDGSI